MANWNSSDAFKHQKKRNFIYKSAAQDKNAGAKDQKYFGTFLTTEQHGNALSLYSSPRKKMRSSHSIYSTNRSDQQEADDLCSNLPCDAFQDDVLDVLGDDFTADELCQVAEQTEQQAYTQRQSVNERTNIAVDEPKKTELGSNEGYLGFVSKNRQEIPTEKSGGLFSVCPTDQMKIKDLQDKLQIAQKRINELEENNYEKDGNLKMLQDSLELLKSEETRNKEWVRNIEDRKKSEIMELEKKNAKVVEQLKSKIFFQDQELRQASRPRQGAYTHDNNTESTKRSKSNQMLNSSIVPSGQSFFEKALMESKSPKVRKVSKLQKSSEENQNQLQIQVERGNITNKTLEKKLMKMNSFSSKASNVEVAQRVLKLPNTELYGTCTTYDASPFSSQSILPLLNVNTAVVRKLEDINVQYMSVEQIRLNTYVLSSDLDDSHEVCQAIEEIQEMVNTNVLSSKGDDSDFQLVSNVKPIRVIDSSCSLNCGVGLLPILEYHISQYIQLRMDKDEENIMNTCPSSPSGVYEKKDKDLLIALSLAFDRAVQSLRCLCVLVKYSSKVSEILLKSVQISSKEERKQGNSIQNVITSKERIHDGASELLCLLFTLAVPQPNEPPLITLVSLDVIESLVENCPPEHSCWFFPRLCDSLLLQCLSKEYGLRTLSVVTSILMKSICHHHARWQLEECVLFKIYQGCLTKHVDLAHGNRIRLQLKVVMLVNSILSRNNGGVANLVDCHCSLELLKLLVGLMNKEIIFLDDQSESTMSDQKRLSLEIVQHGIFMLASLVTYNGSSRLLADLRTMVGHKYNSLIIGCLRLFKDIPCMRDLNEVLIDLLDENIEEQEVLGEEDVFEDMEIGERCK